MEIEKLKQEDLELRRQKDIFFKQGLDSPLPIKNRNNFFNLGYFEFNPQAVFILEFFEHEDKKIIEINDTRGNIRKYIRFGEFRFEINGKNCILQAYKSSDDDNLFVPFKDKTNGKETYGAGRYLDLNDKQGEKWILDFNKSYNPWCAYSESYACPLVPIENWLDCEIEAGEKSYSK